MKRSIIVIALSGVFALGTAYAQESSQGAANGSNNAANSQVNAPSGQAQSTTNKTLVRNVQQALNDRGYQAGKTDGLMGPHTEKALKDYQKAQGLQATGKIDSQTLSSLGISRQGSFASFSGTTNESGAQNQTGAGNKSGVGNSSGSSSNGSSQNRY